MSPQLCRVLLRGPPCIVLRYATPRCAVSVVLRCALLLCCVLSSERHCVVLYGPSRLGRPVPAVTFLPSFLPSFHTKRTNERTER